MNQQIDFRAKKWQEFVGQEQVVKAIKIGISASKDRGSILEHILFYGPPGLGKTTLAWLIAKEMNVNIKVTSGPSLTRIGDLASILTQLETGDILFIDEIHRLNKSVEETLYPAMEDFALDMIVGKGPGAQSVRIDLNPFTLVGATTKAGMLSAPLRDRFGHIHRLRYYSEDDLQKIIFKVAEALTINIDPDSALEIAKRARGTARIAIKLFRRVSDYIQVEFAGKINNQNVQSALNFYQVDEAGLDEIDRRLLLSIIKDHNGGPVGLETIASLISEDINTITDVYEPFLMQSGFLSRTPRGRTATPKAYQHLKIDRDPK